MESFISIGILGSAFGFFATYFLLIHVFRKPDILLVLLITITFSLSWSLFVAMLNASGLIIQFPHLFRTELPVQFCLAPACFLYVYNFLKKNKKLRLHDFLHFLPAAVVFMSFLPIYFKNIHAKKEIIHICSSEPNSFLLTIECAFSNDWLFWVLNIYTLIYMAILSVALYNQSKNTVYPKANQISDSQLKWLISLTICITLVSLSFLWAVANKSTIDYAYSTYAGTAGITLFCFVFLMFHKPDILYGINLPRQKNTLANDYGPFQRDQIEMYCNEVLEYLENEKVYLKQGYSMDELAEAMNLSKTYLSIILNKGIGMKYNDLINKHRIEYLIQHYTEVNSKNLTIEGLASSVGFNSRTTFLHSVKKFTGLTPTEFIKKIEAENHLAG